MKANVKWHKDLAFIGRSDSGHGVIMDGRAKSGDGLGASPMEMVLMATASCSSIDVVMILKKMRLTVDDVEVEISSQRADTDPKVFTKIHMHFIVSGPGLPDVKVDQAIKLSADKYCSVSIMLGKSVEVTHSFAVVNTAA